KLVLAAGATQQIRNVDVKDCDASGGQTIYADTNSVNSSNNLNWVFGPPTFSSITWVSVSSITVSYSSASSPDAYVLDASTASSFAPFTIVLSSAAKNFAPFALTMGDLSPLSAGT